MVTYFTSKSSSSREATKSNQHGYHQKQQWDGIDKGLTYYTSSSHALRKTYAETFRMCLNVLIGKVWFYFS